MPSQAADSADPATSGAKMPDEAALLLFPGCAMWTGRRELVAWN